MALTIGTGTFTSGSSNVTGVTFSSGGPSFIASGTVATVGKDPLLAEVEFIEATISTITLRNDWDLPSGTYAFVAKYTTESLRDSVNSAKSFADQLEQANGLIASLGSIYGSTAEGLAATVGGDYFSVAGTGDTFITLYLNDNGVAVEQESVASKSRIDLAIIKADEAAVSAANAATSETNAANTYAAFTTDYDQFNLDYAQFNTDFSTFSTNYSTFVTDYGQFSTDYSQFSSDFSTFSTNYAQFVTDYGDFSTNYAQFVTDFGTFSTDYAQFVTDYGTFTTDFSTFSTNYSQFDTDYTQFSTVDLPLALSYKNDAELARDIALATANFQGEWSAQTGAANKPYAVAHEPSGENDQIWALNNDLADVTTSEPSASNPDWTSVGQVGGVGSTDLSYTASPTDGTVESSTGTNATIPLADGVNAGLLTPGEKTEIANSTQSVTSATSTVVVDNTDPRNPVIGFSPQFGDYDASDITAPASATNYTPATNTVLAHLNGIDTALGSISGNTDLTYTASPTNGVVESSTGTNATIPLADGVNAGLLSSSEKTEIGSSVQSVTGDGVDNTDPRNPVISAAGGYGGFIQTFQTANFPSSGISRTPGVTFVPYFDATDSTIENNIAGASVASSTEITLPAGTYRICAQYAVERPGASDILACNDFIVSSSGDSINKQISNFNGSGNTDTTAGNDQNELFTVIELTQATTLGHNVEAIQSAVSFYGTGNFSILIEKVA